MNSETNSTTVCSTYSHSQRLRHQLQQLFSCFFLKGKMTVYLANAPHQIEVFLTLPESTNLFSQNKEVSLLFKFSAGYPEEPPAVFLTCDLFPHQKSFIDVINQDNWESSVTLTQILKNFIDDVEENGLKNTLNTIFNSNHKIQSSYRHIKEQNNISIQPKSTFNNFISPFSCFRPLQQSFSPVPQVTSKPTYTPIKYKKKNNSDMKFYDISENKHSDQSRGQEKGKKKQAKPMNKNANLPKFLIRIFIKYVDRFKQLYVKKQYDKLQVQCRKMKDWKRHDKKQHAFGLKHLKRFFQDQEDGYPSPYLNRKVIMQIIQKYLLEQICQNSQIPDTHRVGYLVACRVYSLRCRNSVLAGRIQSK